VRAAALWKRFRAARRPGGAALAAAFVAALTAPAPACDSGFVTASPSLVDLYFTAYDRMLAESLARAVDGTTYISTGDIEAEWLRDSSAVARAYVPNAKTDATVAQLVRGTIARQATYILIDPYANAFSENYQVVERKFEADSLLYPVWLAYFYWRTTGDATVFTGAESRAYDQILEVLRNEQRHDERSQYRHSALPNGGRGTPVAFTGMIWSGFRPSDDPTQYGYNIPVNAFATVVLQDMTTIEKQVYHNEKQAENAWGLSVQVQRGVEQAGVVTTPGVGRMYAYEVDGLGHVNLMDDANVPSLLSLPYFGYVPVTDTTYQTTRSFVLSPANPYFYTGTRAQGVGSPHTPRRYIWPLALIMQGLTSTSDDETARVLGYIAASDSGDHRLHESFDADDPSKYTRGDFAWPNALYTELITALHPKADSPSALDLECFAGIPQRAQ
jgi:meiotically up-regulated gene 157 (Mug157) protein